MFSVEFSIYSLFLYYIIIIIIILSMEKWKYNFIYDANFKLFLSCHGQKCIYLLNLSFINF